MGLVITIQLQLRCNVAQKHNNQTYSKPFHLMIGEPHAVNYICYFHFGYFFRNLRLHLGMLRVLLQIHHQDVHHQEVHAIVVGRTLTNYLK